MAWVPGNHFGTLARGDRRTLRCGRTLPRRDRSDRSSRPRKVRQPESKPGSSPGLPTSQPESAQPNGIPRSTHKAQEIEPCNPPDVSGVPARSVDHPASPFCQIRVLFTHMLTSTGFSNTCLSEAAIGGAAIHGIVRLAGMIMVRGSVIVPPCDRLIANFLHRRGTPFPSHLFHSLSGSWWRLRRAEPLCRPHYRSHSPQWRYLRRLPQGCRRRPRLRAQRPHSLRRRNRPCLPLLLPMKTAALAGPVRSMSQPASSATPR